MATAYPYYECRIGSQVVVRGSWLEANTAGKALAKEGKKNVKVIGTTQPPTLPGGIEIFRAAVDARKEELSEAQIRADWENNFALGHTLLMSSMPLDNTLSFGDETKKFMSGLNPAEKNQFLDLVDPHATTGHRRYSAELVDACVKEFTLGAYRISPEERQAAWDAAEANSVVASYKLSLLVDMIRERAAQKLGSGQCAGA